MDSHGKTPHAKPYAFVLLYCLLMPFIVNIITIPDKTIHKKILVIGINTRANPKNLINKNSPINIDKIVTNIYKLLLKIRFIILPAASPCVIHSKNHNFLSSKYSWQV